MFEFQVPIDHGRGYTQGEHKLVLTLEGSLSRRESERVRGGALAHWLWSGCNHFVLLDFSHGRGRSPDGVNHVLSVSESMDVVHMC